MIVTVLKGGFVKMGPKMVTYRDFSKFSAVDFKDYLVHIVSSELSEIEDYGAIEAGVMRVLKEHAPIKKKSIRANDGPFITKALRKEHMHRTRLRNKYQNNRLMQILRYLKSRGTNVLNCYERPNLITIRILTLVTSRIIVSSGRLAKQSFHIRSRKTHLSLLLKMVK